MESSARKQDGARTRRRWYRPRSPGPVLALVILAALVVPGAAQADPFAYVTNLGGGDVSQYDIGAGGTLAALSPPTVTAGSLPIVGAATPDGSSVYVTNEGTNDISQYDVGTGGGLTPKSPPTVAAGLTPLGLAMSPDGGSVYVANQSDDTVSQYDVGPGGALTPKSPPTVAGGDGPELLTVSPDGSSLYVTNINDNTVSQYDVGTGGTLTPKSPAAVATGIQPIGVKVSPDGASAYVTNAVDGTVSQYDVGTGGTLTPKTPPAVPAGLTPIDVVVTPDGTSAYVSNFGTDNVSLYDVGAGGILTPKLPAVVAAGDGPQLAAVTPDGTSVYVANGSNDTVSQYDVGTGGTLAPKSPAAVSAGVTPTSVTIASPVPQVSIDDVTQVEGDSGTTAYNFTVSLSQASSQQVDVTAESQDGSATTADSDYQALAPSTVSFAPNDTSEQVTVTVNGDDKFEPAEAFNVKLSSPVNAAIEDDTGVGTITNDDSQPTISIDDVTHNEGNSGTTAFTFTVSLSNASYQQVDVFAQSQDSTAFVADNDYQQLAATQITFAPGDTSEQVTVNVNGDTAFEADETFIIELFNATNATEADPMGVGTITNDDAAPSLQTQSFPAQADARVEEERSSSNFGSSTFLRADNDDEVRSYLRFNLSGISGTIQSAKLKVFATEGTSNGPAAYKTNWTGSESSLTWNNKPSATSGATDDKGSIASSSFVEYEVKSLVSGNGLHSFILRTSSSDGVDFASKESSNAARRPQLNVTYGTDTQDPTPPTLSAQAVSSTQVNLSWSGATDDFGVTGYKIYRDNLLRATVGTQTSYTDSATAGNTYVYEVSALDAAGNESADSNAVTVKTPFTFTAAADARVEQANASSNFGTSTLLRVDAGSDPDIETFLRFQLSGLTTISDAKLRLWVTNGTNNGPAAYKTSWTGSETSLRWNSGRTPRTAGPADDKGAISSNTFVDFNVTTLGVANGSNSFILAGTSTDGVDFSSRETSTSSRRPVLLVTP